jgi:DNA-directed RNA polymerase specialized sigma24 family protein
MRLTDDMERIESRDLLDSAGLNDTDEGPSLTEEPAIGRSNRSSAVKRPTTRGPTSLCDLNSSTDEELLASLRLEEFDGPDWEEFSEFLACYGYEIIRTWIRTHHIFVLCHRRGLARGLRVPDDRSWSEDEVDELAIETVALAISRFRVVLQSGRWSSDRGASIKTFFVGQCLFQFGDVYRRWLQETRPSPWIELSGLNEEDYPPHGPLYEDPAKTVIARQEALRGLASALNDRTRCVLVLIAEGYTQAEIAKALATTAKAVEQLLYRHRQRTRRNEELAP